MSSSTVSCTSSRCSKQPQASPHRSSHRHSRRLAPAGQRDGPRCGPKKEDGPLHHVTCCGRVCVTCAAIRVAVWVACSRYTVWALSVTRRSKWRVPVSLHELLMHHYGRKRVGEAPVTLPITWSSHSGTTIRHIATTMLSIVLPEPCGSNTDRSDGVTAYAAWIQESQCSIVVAPST